jgi:catechol 2,3-dioxygenase-like lactoylglutathione lyase family enzyme
MTFRAPKCEVDSRGSPVAPLETDKLAAKPAPAARTSGILAAHATPCPEATVIHHLSFYATDFAATKAFYEKALAPLGSKVTAEFTASWNPAWPTQRMCAFGPEGKMVLWVIEAKEKASPRHLALSAKSHAEVQAFYKAALAAGGKDNGPPGPRKDYSPSYYAAFVIDPDGNNIEAVTT